VFPCSILPKASKKVLHATNNVKHKGIENKVSLSQSRLIRAMQAPKKIKADKHKSNVPKKKQNQQKSLFFIFPMSVFLLVK
jgi:hypothetical protein